MYQALRKVWQVLSFLLLLYGFYLFFLFAWDTLVRVEEKVALPVAFLLTAVLAGVSALFWVRKRRGG